MDKTSLNDTENEKRGQLKTIFLTGVTGLLGTNLVHELLAQNYTVYAIVRDKNNYVGLRHKNLTLLQMGLWGDYDSYLRKAAFVVHLAADTSSDKVNPEHHHRVNFEATKRLFDHAKEQGVQQFTFISTANTIGFGSLSHPGKEGHPIRRPFKNLFYAQSKARAEEYLQHHKRDMKVIILNPTFMMGAYDSKPSSGQIILMALKKPIVVYPPGGKNFVPVKDVVQAVLQSFIYGFSGEKYLIAGENFSYKTFFKKLKKITGDQQWLIPAPKFLLFLVGGFGELLLRLKVKTRVNITTMKVLCVNNYYCHKKSEKGLHLQYTSIDEAIEEAKDYLAKSRLK